MPKTLLRNKSAAEDGHEKRKETAEGEMNMRWGDPLIGRMELYYLVGVAALLGVAYLVRAAVG